MRLGPAQAFLEERGRELAEIVAALLIYNVGGIVAGFFLLWGRETLLVHPEVLVLVPILQDLRGNMYSSLASRLSTLLHLGLMEPRALDPRLAGELALRLAAVLSMSLVVAVLGGAASAVLGYGFAFPEYLVLALGSSLLVFLILFPLTAVLSAATFRRGIDPDNTVSPLVQTLGDMITVPALFLVLFAAPIPQSWGVVALLAAVVAVPPVLVLARSGRRFAELVTALAVAVALSTATGLVLGANAETVLGEAGFIGIVPAFIGSCGALSSIVGAKLSTGLHTGTVPSRMIPSGEALGVAALTFLATPLIYTVVGVVGFYAAGFYALAPPGLVQYIAVSLLGGLILMAIAFLETYYIAVLSWLLGLDPDNTTIPLLTSIVDVEGILILIAVIKTLGYA